MKLYYTDGWPNLIGYFTGDEWGYLVCYPLYFMKVIKMWRFPQNNPDEFWEPITKEEIFLQTISANTFTPEEAREHKEFINYCFSYFLKK